MTATAQGEAWDSEHLNLGVCREAVALEDAMSSPSLCSNPDAFVVCLGTK